MASRKVPEPRSRGAGTLLVALYVVLILSPPIVATIANIQSGDGLAVTLGHHFALVAFAILAMQPVLSGRYKWISRPFGMDMVYGFHKAMGVFAAGLLVAHPILMAAGGFGLSLLVGPGVPWDVWVGRAALTLLLVQVLFSGYRAVLGVEFQKWLKTHNALAIAVLAGAFVHSWFLGPDIQNQAMRTLWVALIVTAIVAYAAHRVVRTQWNRFHRYTVLDVSPETHNVWTIRMLAPDGNNHHRYLPGQFHYVTLYRGPGLPVEEHHFTISSSPTENGILASSIKESGDFTRTIGRTKAGDTVAVQGPYGRFSYLLHPDEKDLVFIAGGIGITPLRSMLRHMADTAADRSVLLVYANRSERDIAFREELTAIESGSRPRLRVIHVLSKPQGRWAGETGHLDPEAVLRLVGDLAVDRAYYVCAPRALADTVTSTLLDAGVDIARVHEERFWFA